MTDEAPGESNERDQYDQARLAALRKAIDFGLDDIAHGRVAPLDVEAFLNDRRREADTLTDRYAHGRLTVGRFCANVEPERAVVAATPSMNPGMEAR
jgi:hypothetical protein